MKPRRLGHVAFLFAGFLSVSGGFLLSYTGIVEVPRFRVELEVPRPTREYLPSYSATNGPEIVLIYIGSSSCPPSNDPNLFQAIDEIKIELRDRALAMDMGFTTLGISKDWNIESGYRHLSRSGPFDEIMTGRNWIGSGLIHYLWQGLPGVAATPQIVVIRRELRVRDHSVADSRYGLDDETLLIRKVGLEEILTWKSLGIPLPPFEPSIPHSY
jgi:hypothetical protein